MAYTGVENPDQLADHFSFYGFQKTDELMAICLTRESALTFIEKQKASLLEPSITAKPLGRCTSALALKESLT